MPDRLKPSRFIPVSTAAALLVGCSTLFFVFTCPWLSSTLCALVPLYDAVLFLFVMANFTMATFMDAGVFPQASEDEDKEEDFRAPLYKNVEVKGIQVRMKWCSSCHFYRPPRCSHCSVCDNCVEDFDHHCPWVNNCIGRRNYRFFFLFLISLSVHITSVFSLSLLYVLHHQESLTSLHSSITMIVMCVAGLFFIPVLGLTGFHVVLVARGRTTNEQVTYTHTHTHTHTYIHTYIKISLFKVTGKFQGGVNPFTHGCYGNVKHVLCSPLAPRYLMDVSKRPVVLVSPPFRRPAHSSCSVVVKVNDNGVHANILTTKAKSSEDRDAQPPLPPKAERHPHHRPHHQIHTQLSSSEESSVSSKATAPPTPAMYKVQAVFGTMPKEQTCATGGQVRAEIPDECQSPVQEERCHDYRSEPNLDVPDYGGVDTPLHRHFLSSPYQLDSFGVKFVTRPGTVQPDTLTSTPNRGVFSPGTMSSRNGSLSYDSLLAPVPPPQPFHSPHLPMKTCHTRRPDAPRQAFHQSPYSPVHAGFMYARERDPSPVRYDNLSQTIMASIQERKDLEEREKLIRRQGYAHTYVCPNDSGMFDGHFAGCRGSRAELSRVGVMAYGSRAHHASASELIRAHATSTSSLHSEGGGHVHSPSHQPPLSPASSPCSPSLSHQKLSYVIAVERVGSPHLSARKDVTLRPANGHSNTRDRALLSPSATPLGHTHHTSIKKVMGVGGTTYEISV